MSLQKLLAEPCLEESGEPAVDKSDGEGPAHNPGEQKPCVGGSPTTTQLRLALT